MEWLLFDQPAKGVRGDQMMQFAVLLVVALGGIPSQGVDARTEQTVPYRSLPADVRTMVVSVLGEACAVDSRHAEIEAKAVRFFRADLDGDGNTDYVFDEWSGPCARNPAHYVHVWMGAGGGRYHYIQRAEAELVHGASGFAWVQTRCNPRATFDFQIEEYRNGSISRSSCYPATAKGEELQKRGLEAAYPK